MTSPLHDPGLEALLDRLHAQSDGQAAETSAFFTEARRASGRDRTQSGFDDDMRQYLTDKLVALDRDKAMFCYQACRALGARRVVEAGTSHGVSTLYLAAAVRDNGHDDGVVIGTEYEPVKAAVAHCPVDQFVERPTTVAVGRVHMDIAEVFVYVVVGICPGHSLPLQSPVQGRRLFRFRPGKGPIASSSGNRAVRVRGASA